MRDEKNNTDPELKQPETSRWYDKDKIFSESKIWELQTGYYTEKGMDAWHSRQVPHYISANPTLARQYARLTLAALHDWLASAGTGNGVADEPLMVLELGTGHGRFSYHFLKALEELAAAPLEALPLQYLQSDLVEANIKFWLDHPLLKDWREKGALKAIQLDATKPFNEFVDYESGRKLDLTARKAPMVVVANYLFDSLPADVYYLKDGRVYEGLLSLECDKEGEPVMEDLYKTLHPRWSIAPADVAGDSPASRYLPLLEEYGGFSEGYAILPGAALDIIRRLNRLTIYPTLILAGDKGPRDLEEAVTSGPPYIASHGSVSISVNFHALIAYVLSVGGEVLQPSHAPSGFTNLGFLLNGGSLPWHGLRHDYRLYNGRFGGDEFFVLNKCLESQITDMGVKEILSWLRLSYYDAHVFSLVADRLGYLTDSPEYFRNRDVEAALDHVWEGYFRLGSGPDVAGQIGFVLFKLGMFEKALRYLALSEEDYDFNTNNGYLTMMCHYRLKRLEEAKEACGKVWKLDPGFMETKRYARLLGVKGE